MEIRWSPSALLRLEEISAFIANDAPVNAIRFIDKLINSVERLRNFPLSGAIIRENFAFRHIVVQGYRVIYRVRKDAIEIVTVISPGLSV